MTRFKRFLQMMLIFTVLEAALLVAFVVDKPDFSQDTVLVNEILQTVKNDWGNMKAHRNQTEADYVVLDEAERVLYRTKSGLSESMHTAISHRDTVVTVENDGTVAGSILICNDTQKQFQKQKQRLISILAAAVLLQGFVCAGYTWYLNCRMVRPFEKLRGFAERIAQGNLDIPLEMDRNNLFGAFTESFDIMRAELKKARMAEEAANAAKKELIARLSHDIKTPIASIKAASEVGCAIADNERMQENYRQIIQKTDQINTLVTNLFTATLEELQHLSVKPADMESSELIRLLENADYLHRAVIPTIPQCLLFADPLRLQQVFDNLFANSYKYAGTKIDITVKQEVHALSLCIEDHGGGVAEHELPLLKEKYKRAGNAAGIEGAGLGLFISECFMKEMRGGIFLENGPDGLKATVQIALSLE